MRILFLSFACERNSENLSITEGEELYVDSLSFIYAAKKHPPYLLSIDSYAYNDSMNAVLDTLNSDATAKLNSTDGRYDDPLIYRRSFDAIFFDFIYTPARGRFHFAEIKSSNDSIFMWLSGYVDKGKNAKPAKHCPCRVRAVFQMLVKDSTDYKIFFRVGPAYAGK
ncbi:MAG TPA: hypothetical protein VIU12_31490 [Chryseolinea sp.]